MSGGGRRLIGSLRFRLLAGAAVWIALALALAGLVLSGLFRDHVARRFEAELTNHLDQLAALTELGADGAPVLRQPLSDPRFRRPLSGLYWQVGPGDAPALRSRSLWDEALALPPDEVADGDIHRHSVVGPAGRQLSVLERAVTLPNGTAPLRMAVAQDEAELRAVVADFNRVLWLSLGALALALIAAAVVQVSVGLRPLVRLRAELAAVRAGRKKRFGGDSPREVQPLLDDLNALLDHSEEVVVRARLQAGNLAHALKTNLAVLANEAEGEAAARRVAEMRRHIDHHMARARAAAARGLPGVATPVADSAGALARVLEKLQGGGRVTVAVRVPREHVFAGERADLDEMLGNLLDNAMKWAGSRVEVASRLEAGGMLAVVVEDDGPGLPANRRDAVLAPGVRLDESTPGSGLGLAVVRDVARLYGGDLRLGDSPLGGLRVELVLPAAPPS
ncbi:sensor histidine kinase [Azospirillum brasilense]|uniref:sensor histidine kinase n=1 Tax=Azospirillum brasilense TaxID=192 RepID=UPI000E69309E|nr:sensor histidine kinase [Azospirillum brasilense]NUB35267.1 ATP-binding protein [Azospirillum brasilense]RIW04608.1 ATP-binding protein [Azospirillum brasilense]